MKGQTDAKTPREYIDALPEPRRGDVSRLDALIRKVAPRLEPVISMRMLGYGPFRYRYASGREGDAARIAIGANASSISLYLLSVDARGYVAERYRDRLPKANVGKSCVRFRRLDDLDLDVLRELISEAARTPFGEFEVAAGPAVRARRRLEAAARLRSARLGFEAGGSVSKRRGSASKRRLGFEGAARSRSGGSVSKRRGSVSKRGGSTSKRR